ncbi:MAG: SulP family inorganic anion transporter [Chloroflexota bacterium]|nr:SulP family inorganic anion transporter [Chloroflexota bacterium]
MAKLKKRAKRYLRGKFRADLTAGLTVAMVVIPQSMAYAAIAGVNPIYGLFTAIIPTVIGALFGSFPFLVTGPTNPTALVTASVLLGYADRSDYLELVLALAILAGLFKLILGLLKLGSITRYISNSVLVGFLSAAGILIIAGQLGNLTGLSLPKSGGVWTITSSLFQNLKEINPLSLIIGITSICIMLVIRSLKRKLPAALITIIITSLLVYLTGWNQSGIRLVTDYGLPEKLGLSFHIPDISLGEYFSLGISGAAVALFSVMEAVSIAKSMSQMTGDHLDPSKEMIGQGLASFVGGFFYCMPSSGSPSRTVINVVNGAKTRFASILSGLSVLIFLLLFSRLIGYIPIPALAAVVIVSSAGLINIALIKLTWQSRLNSRIVMLITFVSSLILPLEYAIYLGVISTILIYLGESGQVKINYILEDEDGQFIEQPLNRIEKQNPRIAILNVEGDLYFAAIESLQEQVERILKTDIKVLILRFRRTHLLASTGIIALNQIIRKAKEQDVDMLFCGIQEEIRGPLEDAGVIRTIGTSRIFIASDIIFDSTQRALEKAKEILNARERS